VLLLGVEQLEPGRKPFLTCSCRVVRHSPEDRDGPDGEPNA
jgi:hypothetical protein